MAECYQSIVILLHPELCQRNVPWIKFIMWKVSEGHLWFDRTFFYKPTFDFLKSTFVIILPSCPCMWFLAGWLNQQIINFPFCELRQNVGDVLIKEIWEPLLSTQHCWLFIMTCYYVDVLTSYFQDSFRHFSGLFVNSFASGKLFEVKRLWKPFCAKCFFLH